MPLDLDFVRSKFPSLESDWVFFDNGGGSQILQHVLDRMREYLLTSNVQHGASYSVSQLAGERLHSAQQAMATLINADSPSEIVMAGSTTALLQMLARSFSRILTPGDEIIVTDSDHESNIGPWLELERVGIEIKFWNVAPDNHELHLEDLVPLLGPRTRLVSVTHTSNVFGTINPIRRIADIVHESGALLCVDGVALAPHRAVDVQAMDVDFYAFSFYKCFGPHHALLYGKRSHLLKLPSQNHFFIAEEDIPYKFQPGNVNYELSYAMIGLMDYLDQLAQHNGNRTGVEPGTPVVDRTAVLEAFEMIAEHEEDLGTHLLEFLRGKPNTRIMGLDSADRNKRVSIVSFTVDDVESSEIVRRVDTHKIGIRFGHFYSARLIDALGLPSEEGVVRVSMVHYNTLDEVDRLTEVLDQVF
jgi:cysteine desulfurase family protein (TIGR01976 family)